MSAMALSLALGWDGRKGSLAKFGCSVGLERFANVPCSEGTVCVWRFNLTIFLHLYF